MRFKSSLSFLILLSISCQTNQLPREVSRFIPQEKSLFNIKEDQQYTFGYLEVPENRSKPNGKTIRLPIYIFKSRNPNPPKDPIIYLVGGPGASVMNSAPYMAYYQYLDDRDFILFEQRGTQYAQPVLSCPEWSAAVFQAGLPETDQGKADSLYRAAAENCRDRLTAEGIDLNAYHTNAIAADIEDLRQTLGIEKYNLLSLSYGTKIAQVLMRDYPEGLRSVVMDSPLPLEANYDAESMQNLLETYDHLFLDCAAEPNCAAAFPDLKNRFFTFLEQITEEPLPVMVLHPTTDKEVNFKIRGRDLIGLLAMVGTAQIPEIPLIISNILAGDLSFIQDYLQEGLQSPGGGIGTGMRLSVWCAEETPFVSRQEIADETKRYPAIVGASPAVFEPEICDIWGVEALPERENQAIKSNIPTLIISGEYDNETPVKWGEQLQKNLQNSFHIIFKGWHHTPTTYWNNPCGMQVANSFFNDPGKKPQLECWQEIKTPKFILE